MVTAKAVRPWTAFFMPPLPPILLSAHSTKFTQSATIPPVRISLKIGDRLHRAAKAEAAREGIPFNQFVEEAIAVRLHLPPTVPSAHIFPTYAAGRPLTPPNDHPASPDKPDFPAVWLERSPSAPDPLA